jgi:acetoin utilization deacetylase AcuC-like enzyme
VRVEAVPAVDEHLVLAHPMTHIKKIKDTIYSSTPEYGKEVLLSKGQNTRRFAHDTYENMHTARAAYLAAGGTVEAVKAVV